MGSVRTTDPGWLAATTPVPSPKRRRRVSARLFGHSSIEVARRARFPTLIRHARYDFRIWQILLQKSDARDRVVWPFVRGGGFKPPALTLFTQLQLYAMHRTSAGGGRATNDASRRRF